MLGATSEYRGGGRRKRDGEKAELVETSEAQREDADDGMRRPQL